MFLLSLLPRQMQKMKAQWVWKYQQVREIIFSDDISICFGLSDQSMRNQDRALWQWGNRAELLQGSWEDCCCSPVQAYYLLKQQKCYLAYRPGQILANTGLSPLISLYSAVFSNMVMYVWVLLAQSIPEPLTFSAVTVSCPKQLMLDILTSLSSAGLSTETAQIWLYHFIFFFSSAFTHSVIELHWSGTKQILSIRHQPLVSALTAHNGLWDQALIERVISHDFLVIAFNDLILNPSRRQRQLRALSIRDGAQCLTDWDLIWPGFLKVVV